MACAAVEAPGLTRATAVVALALLVLLMGTQLTPTPSASAQAGSSSPAGWWNSSYQFRRSFTIDYGGSTPIVNQTVVVHLNFTGNEVEDPFTSVRLVDSSGNEVPSVIAAPQYSGVFLRSAFLVFRSDLQPHSSVTYYVYYGGAFQPLPSYRSPGGVKSLASGFVTAQNVPLSLDSTELQIMFGTVDSETLVSGVSYAAGSAASSYGPPGISRLQFVNDSGLVLAGALDSQTEVAYDVFQAGSLQLTRIIIVSASSAITIDAVSNGGAQAASNVTLTSVVGLGGLSALGTSESAYSDPTALLYTQNPDGYFDVQQSSPASSFALGTTSAVDSQALSGRFSGVGTYTLASAAGFQWNLGALQPSSASWVSSSWGVASNASAIGATLAPPIGGTLGVQEVLGVATPTASSLWSTAVTFTDLVVPPSGVVVPFGIGDAQLVAGASSISGTYSYSIPPPSTLASDIWTPSTSSTGNGTAYSSPSYYAFDLGQSVQRVSGEIPNGASTVTGSLISIPGFAFRGSNAVLQVKYKASHTVTSGTLSNQDLFISADIDPTLTGNFSESVLLPVSGSSTTIPSSGCSLTGTPAPTLETVAPAGYLIGDDTWRTLSVSLPSDLPASGFNVMLRVCLSTAPGFSGALDLEVASAGVVLTGPLTSVLQSGFSSAAPQLTMAYLPQAQSVSQVGTTVNMTVSLVYKTNSAIGWEDGTAFSGAIAAPSAALVNASGQYATIGSPVLDGVLVGSAASSFATSGEINGSPQPVIRGQGVAFLEYTGLSGVSGGTPFSLALTGEAVSVTVLDTNNDAVPGVQVVPLEGNRALPISSPTNDSGIATLQLVPWTFQFNATYQDQVVGTGEVLVGAAPTVTINTDLYNITLLVKDSRGGVLPEAQVSLSLGGYNFTGTTDSQGMYSFEGVANAIYSATVYVGSGAYFTGQVGATANNATIQVATSYLTPSQQLLITGLLALVPVALVAGYILTRRLRRTP